MNRNGAENSNHMKSRLRLPKANYGPFCLKILEDFIGYHELDKKLPRPVPGLETHETLSRIFDIMLYSMGKRQRIKILDELDKYKMDIPAGLR